MALLTPLCRSRIVQSEHSKRGETQSLEKATATHRAEISSKNTRSYRSQQAFLLPTSGSVNVALLN